MATYSATSRAREAHRRPPGRMHALVGKFTTLRVLWTFLLIDLGFWALGFDRTFQWIAKAGRKAPRAAEDVAEHEVEAIFAAVQRANRFYYRRRLDCLPKALATYRFLRLHRVPAQLCLGVRKYPFSGHAWVEFEGKVLDDQPDRVRGYTLLKRLT